MTTRSAFAEVRHGTRVPEGVEVVETGPLDDRLAEAGRASATPGSRSHPPSPVDLGLVQALVEDPGLAGLLTEDRGLLKIHVPSLVRQVAGREVFAMTCDAYAAKNLGSFDAR